LFLPVFLQLPVSQLALLVRLDFQLPVSQLALLVQRALPVEHQSLAQLAVSLVDHLLVLLAGRSDFVLNPKLNHPLF
jgi:hypothetical protein